MDHTAMHTICNLGHSIPLAGTSRQPNNGLSGFFIMLCVSLMSMCNVTNTISLTERAMKTNVKLIMKVLFT